MKPKLVAIARVKNEVDILEAFIRHHLQILDKIIVSDDGSDDGTLEILCELQREGLQLIVLRQTSIGYDQSCHMSKLMCLAISALGADWVLPLDADEFLELPFGESLWDRLASENDLLFVPWSNFVWTPAQESDSELNPVLRLLRRTPPRQDQVKVLVPASVGMSKGAILHQGNHGLSNAEGVLQAKLLPGVVLCHFPIRSYEQYASKVAIGHLQYRVIPNREPAYGHHYVKPFALLKASRKQFLAEMEGQSRRYSAEEGLILNEFCQFEPLNYMGGALRFTPGLASFASNLLRHAEKIADRLVETMLATDSLCPSGETHCFNDIPQADRRDTYILADGVTIFPFFSGDNELRFLLPVSTKEIRLISSVLDRVGSDVRSLGVIVDGFAVSDGSGWRDIPLDDPSLYAGFNEIEREGAKAWRWTDGDGHVSSNLWSDLTGPVILRIRGVFIGLRSMIISDANNGSKQ